MTLKGKQNIAAGFLVQMLQTTVSFKHSLLVKFLKTHSAPKLAQTSLSIPVRAFWNLKPFSSTEQHMVGRITTKLTVYKRLIFMCLERWFPQLADPLSVAACVAVRSGVLGTSLVLQASPPWVELCIRIPVMSGSSVFQEHFGILVPGANRKRKGAKGSRLF